MRSTRPLNLMLGVACLTACSGQAEVLIAGSGPTAGPSSSSPADANALSCGALGTMTAIADSFGDAGGKATPEEAANAMATFGRDFDPAEHDVQVQDGQVTYRRDGLLVARVVFRRLGDGTYDAETLHACADRPAPQG